MTAHGGRPVRLSLKQIERDYGIPYATLYALVRSGDLPARNVAPGRGVRWNVAVADLEAWLDSLEDAEAVDGRRW